MNIQNLETILIGTLVSTLFFAFFVYTGNIFLKFLKSKHPRRFQPDTVNLKPEIPGSVKNRRIIVESAPNTVCSLPIHQEARSEAPLY